MKQILSIESKRIYKTECSSINAIINHCWTRNFSCCFHCMSAYSLLVGSVLVIKLYWWFAFSVLETRESVCTCNVLNRILQKSSRVFSNITHLYFLNRGNGQTKYVHISIIHSEVKCWISQSIHHKWAYKLRVDSLRCRLYVMCVCVEVCSFDHQCFTTKLLFINI